jgi:hypothetical protein
MPRGHEPQRAVDLSRELVVALPLGALVDVLEVPRVHARQVGEATLGEGAHEVQRGGGLVVGAQQPSRVRTTGRGLEREVVHHVAAERRQLRAVAPLDR